MEALIFAKAEVNAKNDDGEETPLHIAVYKGNVEAIELLLKNGANPNARMTDGTRPMDIAEKKEKSEVRKLMTKYKGVSNANEEE
jgi:ankyrin repeat protein